MSGWRISPPVRILIGLATGLVAGALLAGRPWGASLAMVAGPVGRLWLDALTMTVVPLVFSLLAGGVMAAAMQAAGGRIVLRSLLWFAVLLLAACMLGAASTLVTLDLFPLPAAARLLPEAAGPASTALSGLPGSGDWLAGIIPTNPIKAAAETAMVPVVVFALLFGLAASRIDPALRGAVDRLVRALAETMLVIVGWVLLVAPIGVLALAFGVGQRLGGGAAGVLAHYVAVVIATAIVSILFVYTVAILFGRIGPLAFARAALPAQVIAVSTQSSLACLPAMVEAAPGLRVAQSSAGVVLPLAVSLFRLTSAAVNVAVALYLAEVHQVVPGPAAVAAGVIVAALVSIAAVGLPAQVSFFAIVAPVCLAMGVPVALLPLLLAIETLPDVFRTLGNVTADIAVMAIVGRRGGADGGGEGVGGGNGPA
ncbi:dicarboxylate/amino acid:cation symporter [Sphingomonas abaci]|uniref:Na+/H+-dicarboxylate symporter n=1 Tax=Sphingomonas abaci TaxID=237611 RepID=A0A7W7F0K7_9SPHN|nr:cation:dicarboxylase symporter family transporter [Sphingomonas abaci]MBB4618440.1 Na+/H+-dicarboxylate symporter [Sphingomonas abaci]